MAAQGKEPEILFWVGCAGSFDERAQRITRDICKILSHVGISFAVLGTEEACTGDPAKRAGNEFLFQMQAMQNVEMLNEVFGDKPTKTTAIGRPTGITSNWITFRGSR